MVYDNVARPVTIAGRNRNHRNRHRSVLSATGIPRRFRTSYQLVLSVLNSSNQVVQQVDKNVVVNNSVHALGTLRPANMSASQSGA